MKVSGLAPSATPRRVISAKPRVMSAARAFKPSCKPSHKPVAMALKSLAAAARAGNAAGQLDVAAAEAAAMDALRQRSWTPDYITLRRQHDLSPVTGPCAEPLVVLGAAKLGKTRLIDNLEV
jgi:pantothenate synthetase